MTTTLPQAPTVALGPRLIERLANGDVEGAGSLLAPTIDFKALIPPGLVEAADRAATEAVLVEWFPPGRVEALEMLDAGTIGDRHRVSYRVRWTDTDGRSLVFEQHAYYDCDATGITWLRLVCSGDHPVETPAG